jgi:hypothetical protein
MVLIKTQIRIAILFKLCYFSKKISNRIISLKSYSNRVIFQKNSLCRHISNQRWLFFVRFGFCLKNNHTIFKKKLKPKLNWNQFQPTNFNSIWLIYVKNWKNLYYFFGLFWAFCDFSWAFNELVFDVKNIF